MRVSVSVNVIIVHKNTFWMYFICKSKFQNIGLNIKLSDLNLCCIYSVSRKLIIILTTPFFRFYIISKGTNRRKKIFHIAIIGIVTFNAKCYVYQTCHIFTWNFLLISHVWFFFQIRKLCLKQILFLLKVSSYSFTNIRHVIVL